MTIVRSRFINIIASLSLVGFCYIFGTYYEEPEPTYYEEIVIEDISGTRGPEIETSILSKSNSIILSSYEIELVALITIAEAEGQSEEGKRLVIDSILNRVEHERFPNTVEEVIFQPNQFSCVWDGRVERCNVTNDVIDLVNEEMQNRTNGDVIFFRTGRYSSYGSPMFKVEDHYFSSY